MMFQFKPFDPYGELSSYYTDLPHWRQDGCTYFITYRLADSIPKQILEDWENEKAEWIGFELKEEVCKSGWKDAFEKLNLTQRHEFMKAFNRKLNEYLDKGRGRCVLKSKSCQKVVLDSWQYFHEERYFLGDLVIMPNHIHLIVTPYPGYDLEKILQSRKRQSSREINQLLSREGSLWQKHSYDHIVRNEKEVYAYRDYIRENPIKANLAESQYLYQEFDWSTVFEN